MYYTTAYGRFGTPTTGYLDDVGGPMTRDDIHYLTRWPQIQVAVESYAFTFDAIAGEAEVGEAVYGKECASCHGEKGEGGTGTALGNPAMLSLTSDTFLKFAIENGRDGTDHCIANRSRADTEFVREMRHDNALTLRKLVGNDTCLNRAIHRVVGGIGPGSSEHSCSAVNTGKELGGTSQARYVISSRITTVAL